MKRFQALTITSLIVLSVGVMPARAQAQGKSAQAHAKNAQKREEKRLSKQEQQIRIQLQQQRATLYRQRLNQQLIAAQQLSAQLQQQKRLAQYRNQLRYEAQLRQQQALLRSMNSSPTDPYIYTVSNYRYNLNGTARQTNQYGVTVLKQAVNLGYQEGYRAGQADRQDGAPANYRATYAYRDANFGYDGRYVDQSDYNYYFREGVRRGYEDGYYSRSQYGTTTNGNTSILGSLLTTILGLVSQ